MSNQIENNLANDFVKFTCSDCNSPMEMDWSEANMEYMWTGKVVCDTCKEPLILKKEWEVKPSLTKRILNVLDYIIFGGLMIFVFCGGLNWLIGLING